MNGEMTVEWRYEPADYLEEGKETNTESYTLTIGDGKAVAKIEQGYFDSHPGIREQLRREIERRLQSTQLFKMQKFKLTYEGMSQTMPDGRTHQFLELPPVSALVSAGSLDFLARDRDGNITRDTRQERLIELKRHTDLLLKHQQDTTLYVLLSTFTAAMNDSHNEFVHLYEIREALEKIFGGQKTALKQLELSPSLNSRFGSICNDEFLRQSRHRGKAIGQLRDATSEELATVRGFAREMIVSYALYLEKLEPS